MYKCMWVYIFKPSTLFLNAFLFRFVVVKGVYVFGFGNPNSDT